MIINYDTINEIEKMLSNETLSVKSSIYADKVIFFVAVNMRDEFKIYYDFTIELPVNSGLHELITAIILKIAEYVYEQGLIDKTNEIRKMLQLPPVKKFNSPNNNGYFI